MMNKLDYFLDIWNFNDLLSVFAAFMITICMLLLDSTTDGSFISVVGAFTVTALYLKFFYFLRIFDRTAPYIRMIIQISSDIKYFIFILLIAIIGFGNGFYILS